MLWLFVIQADVLVCLGKLLQAFYLSLDDSDSLSVTFSICFLSYYLALLNWKNNFGQIWLIILKMFSFGWFKSNQSYRWPSMQRFIYFFGFHRCFHKQEMRKSLAEIPQMKKWISNNTWSDKAFKGIVVNWELPSLPGCRRGLEITHTGPLNYWNKVKN